MAPAQIDSSQRTLVLSHQPDDTARQLRDHQIQRPGFPAFSQERSEAFAELICEPPPNPAANIRALRWLGLVGLADVGHAAQSPGPHLVPQSRVFAAMLMIDQQLRFAYKGITGTHD